MSAGDSESMTREKLVEVAAREEARHYFAGAWSCACGFSFRQNEADLAAHRAAAVLDALGIERVGYERDVIGDADTDRPVFSFSVLGPEAANGQ